MRTLELQIYTIKEKHPTDGSRCWVTPQEHYTQQLVYNEYENCWDTADGDVWIALPEDFLTDNESI